MCPRYLPLETCIYDDGLEYLFQIKSMSISTAVCCEQKESLVKITILINCRPMQYFEVCISVARFVRLLLIVYYGLSK